MSPAARSIYVFGGYLIAVGAFALGAPNLFLAIVFLPPTTEPWLRVLGVVIMAMGMLHMAAARGEQTVFFRASIRTRMFVLTAFVILAALRLAPPILILFGIIDVVAAEWTRRSLTRSVAGLGAA